MGKAGDAEEFIVAPAGIEGGLHMTSGASLKEILAMLLLAETVLRSEHSV